MSDHSNSHGNGSRPPAGASGPEQPQWAAQDVGKTWQLRFFHMAIRLWGRRGAYQIMYFVVLWYIIFNPEIRRRARYYLDRRFPERKNGIGRLWDSYRLVCSFGHILIDQAALLIQGPGILEAACRDEAEVRRAAAAEGGAILLVSHVGCWQIAMTSVTFLNKPVAAVMMPQAEDSPVAAMAGDQLPFSIIDPRNGMESVLEMMQALREGKILSIMGDRVFGGRQNRVHTEFLGDEIALPASPYRLAAAAGVPILVLQAARMGPERYEIGLARIIEVERERGAGEDYSLPARRFAETMEDFVEQHPWQFFNFFDLWGQEPYQQKAEAD